MRKGLTGNLLYMFLPMLLNGCCTYLTIDSSTHAYRHDSVARIEKAVLASDDSLVVWVEGARAESPKIRKFTMTVSLPPNEDGVWVSQEGMQEGWRTPEDLVQSLPLAIGPSVVLPAYQSALGNQDKFQPIAGSGRTLYLVQHSKPDMRTSFFYASADPHSRTIEIGFDGRKVKPPQKYPFLLFVPLTAAVDVATLPFQIYWLSTLGDKPRNVTPTRP